MTIIKGMLQNDHHLAKVPDQNQITKTLNLAGLDQRNFKSPDSGPLSRPRTTGNLKWNLVGHPLKWNASCRSSDFHMGQHRNDSHREDAPDLTGFQLSDGRIRQTGLSCCLDSEFMSHKIRIEICILSF